ncbi:zinc-ribbon domain-containing protein [Solemya velum gill symbiont]|uniref:zinc-ribbon domain-containing protein n=1 Tax=Solemya velum gill symbiont TaxID=2340 RepID=UPI0009C47268|nr:GIY-YIG nuclease family protein [Solemya velum gill symbiont]OOZ61597.1 hypothetical protein BOW45_13010 [Solemya velum gill symbiont]
MPKKLTKEIVNQRLSDREIELVGEYSNKAKITTFRCQNGHEWQASPGNVMRGTGCPHCPTRSSLSKSAVNERIADRRIKLIGNYSNARTKTTFKCSKGHEWLATPGSVMRGSSCPVCAGNAPLTKEIVNDRIAKRGIELISEYVNTDTRATFRCKKGHEWQTKPGDVLSGKGCRVCAGLAPLTKEIVNERLAERGIELIGDYSANHTKTTFRCKKGHEWEAAPSSIYKKEGSGCPYCSNRSTLSRADVNRCIANRGLFLAGKYIDDITHTTFKCKHGHLWEAIPDKVIGGQDCPVCAGNAPLTKETVNERIRERGLKLVGDYISANTKTVFKCQIKHEWKATPGSILAGTGCPSCAEHGFNPDKPAILYYLKIETRNQRVYKIGITNRTVEERFTGDMDKITILNIEHYEVGADAHEKEQQLLKQCAEYRYIGDDILSQGGNTELFTKDILGLD